MTTYAKIKVPAVVFDPKDGITDNNSMSVDLTNHLFNTRDNAGVDDQLAIAPVNLGTGANGSGVFYQKSGNQLQFKRLKQGANVTITEEANDLLISATGGGGGGSGDMLKSTYDTTNNGIVDNSEALNGQAASFYLSRTNHTGNQSVSTITGLSTVATTGTLDSLSDVTAPSPTTGQALTWSGSAWVNSTVSGSGDMLKSTYDTTNNGIVDNAEKLNNQAASFYLSRTNHTGTQAVSTITGLSTVATTGTLDSLSDVTAPSPTNGQVLSWNGSAWVNASVAGSGDMLKSTYDTTNNGVVDNSEKLDNQSASFYLSRSNHTGTQAAGTITGLASVATTGTLDSLGDVTAPSPTTGQVLSWNGSAWVNSNVGTGTITAASNVGVGGLGLFKQVSGTTLQFKNVIAGSNITLTATGNDEISIAATGGGSGTTYQILSFDSGNIVIKASGSTVDLAAVTAVKDYAIASTARLTLNLPTSIIYDSVYVTFTAGEMNGRTSVRLDCPDMNSATTAAKAIRPFAIRFNAGYGVQSTSSTFSNVSGSVFSTVLGSYTTDTEAKASFTF